VTGVVHGRSGRQVAPRIARAVACCGAGLVQLVARHGARGRLAARPGRRRAARTFGALVVTILVIAACAPSDRGPGVDVERAMSHVRALVARGPRAGDTEASREAAAYIERTLAASRIAVERVPVGTVTIPDIVVLGAMHRRGGARHSRDPNLVVRFGPPAGKALLVMAHYDSVPAGPGAADNAAAVGVLLELARVLAARPPRAPVIVAFTANEELGLLGAEGLAAQRAHEVALAISLDLVGGTGALSLNGAGTLIGTAELRWIAEAADRAGVTVRAPLAHRVVSRWWPQAERSDHGAFTRRGVRAVHFYHRGQDGELIDRAYHTALDDLDRVMPSSVAELGRLLVALAASPPPAAEDRDAGFWLPVAHNTVVPRWLLVAGELALVAFAVLGLVRLRGARARGGLGLGVGALCLALALAAVYALEHVTRGAHPAPWLHAPGYHAIAFALVLAGVMGLVTRMAARIAPWVGARRYLAIAIALPLLVGGAFLAVGAAELAWIWLVPAAVAAAGPRLGRARVLVVVAALLPAVLVLAPDQLREAAWNGFAPASIPLVAWLAAAGIPVIAAAAWCLRHASHSGPLGTLVLSLGWALAMIAGILMVLRAEPPCSASQFLEFHLGCEIRSGVR